MLKNSVYYKFQLLVFALLCVMSTIPVFLLLNAKAETDLMSVLHRMTPEEQYEYYRDVKDKLLEIEAEIDRKESMLGDFISFRNRLVEKLGEYKSDARADVRNSVIDRLGNSPVSAIKTVAKRITVTMPGIELVRELEAVNDAIDSFIDNEIDIAIFQRIGNQTTGTKMGYNEAYDTLETIYNVLDGPHTLKANRVAYGVATATSAKAFSYTRRTVTTKSSITVSRCAAPNGNCYGYYTDEVMENSETVTGENNHLITCSHKHGVSGETGVTYWFCQSTTCPRSDEHWVPCRGGCGELMPPPEQVVTGASVGHVYGTVTIYHDHEAVCKEPIHSFWNPLAKCNKKYFTCQVCPHRAAEGVFLNKRDLSHYDTLVVKIVYEDISFVSLYMKSYSDTSNKKYGDYVTGDYDSDSDGEVVLRKDLSELNEGSYDVYVIIERMEGKNLTFSTYISVD